MKIKPFVIIKEISLEISEKARVHKDIKKLLDSVIKNEFRNPKFKIIVSENTEASGLESGSDD